ncbi:hypothetical protein BIT28_14190 [Photobacterium proteolyticum]|uniref:Uncharacterized protein n=1 Tax=Photobacterium proteolyticum TaxID=1903952 RepID=A0A1Q9H1T6_9GAMM|nr:hypothetical protein [Photobacterium proteolyticum]OLQ81669.1 hypothetical protein BIT28_14190 [Photobacterium proteolyticum]
MENSDWIALASGVVALCALATTAYQAYLSRQHNRLSLAPHLFATTHIDKLDQVARTVLINGGTGPAYVKGYKIIHNSEEVTLDSLDKSILPKMFSGIKHAYNFLHLQDYQVVLPGDKLDVIHFSFPEHIVSENTMFIIQDFDLVIEYECAYGIRKTMDTRALWNKFPSQ